jgi:hypothetical protein
MPEEQTANQQDSTIQTNVRLPADLWACIRKSAIDRRITTQQFVADILTEYLGREKSDVA